MCGWYACRCPLPCHSDKANKRKERGDQAGGDAAGSGRGGVSAKVSSERAKDLSRKRSHSLQDESARVKNGRAGNPAPAADTPAQSYTMDEESVDPCLRDEVPPRPTFCRARCHAPRPARCLVHAPLWAPGLSVV